MDKRVYIAFRTSQEIINRWEALARRRYGDASQENLDKVSEDACRWLLNKWESGDYGFYDYFWRWIAFHCPFKRLKAIAWAKLVFERYLA